MTDDSLDADLRATLDVEPEKVLAAFRMFVYPKVNLHQCENAYFTPLQKALTTACVVCGYACLIEHLCMGG